MLVSAFKKKKKIAKFKKLYFRRYSLRIYILNLYQFEKVVLGRKKKKKES